MKKLISLLAAAVLLFCFAASAAGEESPAIREGIRFGMSPEEVRQAETAPLDKDQLEDGANGFLSYLPPEIDGQTDCVIEYGFTDGKLTKIVMTFNGDSIDKDVISRAYSEVSQALNARLGAPLGNTGGTTAPQITSSMEIAQLAGQVAGMIEAPFQMEYEEWVFPLEGGIIKVDHFYYILEAEETLAWHNMACELFSAEAEGN